MRGFPLGKPISASWELSNYNHSGSSKCTTHATWLPQMPEICVWWAKKVLKNLRRKFSPRLLLVEFALIRNIWKHELGHVKIWCTSLLMFLQLFGVGNPRWYAWGLFFFLSLVPAVSKDLNGFYCCLEHFKFC